MKTSCLGRSEPRVDGVSALSLTTSFLGCSLLGFLIQNTVNRKTSMGISNTRETNLMRDNTNKWLVMTLNAKEWIG